MTEQLLIRVSALSTFVECDRRFEWEYIDGWEKVSTGPPAKASAAQVGTAAHAGLASIYSGNPNYAPAVAEETEGWSMADKLKVQKIMNAYTNTHQKTRQFAFWDVFEVEERMTFPVGVFKGVPVSITGQPDLVMKDEYGAFHMIDHKFTDKPKDVAFRYKRQAMTYDWLFSQRNIGKLETFQFNAVHRSKPEGPPAFDEVVYSDELRENFAVQLDTIVGGIVDLYLGEREAVPNYQDSCNWKCPYFRICPIQDQNPAQALQLLETNYRRDIESSIVKTEKGN